MKKLITFGLSAATALSMTGGALMPIAGAVTIAELQAQIAALTAQLAALSGENTSATTCYVWNGSLTIGSTGPDVTTLQNYLTGTGHFTFSGGATGYFGPITQAAVAAWQAAYGVAPAVGYWGPISQAKYTSMCSEAEEEEGPTGLKGGAGAIEDTELVSGVNNEEVGEGEEDVIVYALDIIADDGSDLEFTAAKLVFEQGDADNDDFGDYADEVSIWFEGEEVARIDADTFDEDNTYTRTVSFDEGALLEAGEEGTLEVAISGVSQIDSDDEEETWTLDITSVRFRDAQDDSVTEDITENARTFSFESFAAAADVEVTVSGGDDAINDARVVPIDDVNETEEESLFSFDVEVEGDSDMTVDDIVVGAVVVNNNGDDLDEFASAFYLFMDGEEVGQEDPPADGEVEITFDDLDLLLETGDTYEFVVKADILETDGAVIENGDTIEFDLTDAGQINDWDVEDEEGDNLADADIGGSANGEALAVYDSGIIVTLVDTSASKSVTADPAATSADIGEFVIEFEVEAFGADAYVGSTAAEDATPDGSDGAEYDVTGTANVALTYDLNSTADQGDSDAWLVEEGETETFTLTVWAECNDAGAGSARLQLTGIGWSLDDEMPDTAYIYNLDNFRTGALNLIEYPA